MDVRIVAHKDVLMDVGVVARDVQAVGLDVAVDVQVVELNAAVVAQLRVLDVGTHVRLVVLAVEVAVTMDALWIAVDAQDALLHVKRIARVAVLYVRQPVGDVRVVLAVAVHVLQVATIAVELAQDVKLAADVQGAVMAVVQDATRVVRAHVRHPVLGSVLPHVFRRVPVNRQLKL